MDTFYVEHRLIPSSDPRLGRHVHHDSRNRDYAFRGSAAALISVRHARQAPVFDQGDLGSCTGNAALGCLGTDPFYMSVPASTPFNEPEAEKVYEKATTLDSAPGSYPPDDTGSDGPSAAKALMAFGLISGYRHAFTVNDCLAALQQWPVIIGINWYQNMFNPDSEGIVTIAKNDTLAGGHEICVDEYDADRGLVGLTNSWGTSWGLDGRFYMSVPTLTRLLGEQGDVTIFTPITAPAPTPTPAPVTDPDLAALISGTAKWRNGKLCTGSAAAKRAVDTYLVAKGVSTPADADRLW